MTYLNIFLSPQDLLSCIFILFLGLSILPHSEDSIVAYLFFYFKLLLNFLLSTESNFLFFII